MGGTELELKSRIDDERIFHELFKVERRECRRLLQRAEKRRSAQVELFHLLEVWRAFELSGHVLDERIPVLVLQLGVILLLQSYRGPCPLRYRLGTDGPRPVRRAYDHAVIKGEYRGEDAVIEIACHLFHAIGAEQVSPSHATCKERVARENDPWCLFGITKQIAHAPHGVARCLHCLYLEPTNAPFLSIMHSGAVLVIEVGIGMPDLCPCLDRELDGTDDEVLMAMGLQDVRDAASRLPGLLYIDVAVPSRVDDEGLRPVAYDIRVMRQPFGLYPLEQHDITLSRKRPCDRWVVRIR